MLVSLAVVGGFAEPASAGTVPLPPSRATAGAGPLLSGDDAVWVTAGYEVPLTVYHSPPDGPLAERLSLPTPPRAGRYPEGFAATPSRVALLHRFAEPSRDGDGGWSPSHSELLVGTRAGGFRALESDQWCLPVGVGAEGDVLVVTRMNCDGREVMVHDLAAGGEPQPLAWSSGPGTHLDHADVRVAGRFVAWHVRGDAPDPMSPVPSRLVVFDRAVGRVAFELRLDQYMGSQAPANFELNFDLQDDGTVVAGVPDYDAGLAAARQTLVWASPAEPRGQVVPVKAADLHFALHGGLIALRRADMRDYAVVDLAGRAVNVFDYNGAYGGAVDFDGRRLVWIQGGALHNEFFPVLATPEVPSGTVQVHPDGRLDLPVWCPHSTSPCRVTVSINVRPPRSGTLVADAASRHRRPASRRVTLPPRKTTKVRLRLPRATRRRLGRNGAVRARAVVHAHGATPRGAPVLLRRSPRRR